MPSLLFIQCLNQRLQASCLFCSHSKLVISVSQRSNNHNLYHITFMLWKNCLNVIQVVEKSSAYLNTFHYVQYYWLCLGAFHQDAIATPPTTLKPFFYFICLFALHQIEIRNIKYLLNHAKHVNCTIQRGKLWPMPCQQKQEIQSGASKKSKSEGKVTVCLSEFSNLLHTI